MAQTNPAATNAYTAQKLPEIDLEVYLGRNSPDRKKLNVPKISIIASHPRCGPRELIYWLIHVHVMDEPYTNEYGLISLSLGKLIRIDSHLGFKVERGINVLYRRVVEVWLRMVKST